MKSLNVLFFVVCLLLFSFSLQAKEFFFDSNGKKSNVESIISKVKHGDIVIIGEQHGFFPSHKNQIQVIKKLQSRGLEVNVGMEFFNYSDQKKLNNYFFNRITEKEFLNSINWRQGKFLRCDKYTSEGGFLDRSEPIPFDCYKRQALASRKHKNGRSIALNLPRKISNKVFKHGLDSLNDKEFSLLPPKFEIGREIYYQRFLELIRSGDHKLFTSVKKIFNFSFVSEVPESLICRMFVAQSLWDDTMAWQAQKFMQSRMGKTSEETIGRPVLVIIVGDFHASYGGGLKDRLLKRQGERQKKEQQIFIISQDIVSKGSSAEKIKEKANPHKVYGPRADLTILSEF